MNTKPKILIVDDKPENLKALRKVLKDLDIELVEATSGNDALKASLRHDFILALLDIQMPEMDGYELAGILREEEKTAHLPFIFISAVYTDNLNVFKGYEKGAFSFITKPFQPEILINKVKFFIEKHQQEIALFELNEELERKVKQISDYKYALDESSIVAVTDQKGIIKEVNNNFCKISKYTREELIGQDHRMINSGYHTKEFMQDLWVTISSGKRWRGEVKNIAKDGTFYWLDTTIVPFLNESGIPYQYMAIRSEITQRKDVEDQLQAVNKELEAFTYSVSHDLRAPLRAVNGYAQMLNDDYNPKLDAEAKRFIDNIKYNATKMGMLIDDLLAFSRLGRKEIQKSNIDMNELTKEVLVDINKSIAHSAEIKIGNLHSAKVDYSLMRQVMFNLISNAVKYSSKKEHPLVEIFSKEKNGEIIFSVKDNGVGFDMHYADKLFGVFQRLHSQKDFEGTGVGLAIVQRIISKHDGKVWAEADLNNGASFYISLPILLL
ncbi:response regulator [Algoriphagus aquimarinus]|uniref:sensor histidine kinase n=1 Tax=Algoriphagus aquimarinus TaxID=237018 RepID=UPI0030DA8685|tara:strand:- start:672 stop:2156 length:1485 start_codon:yes stop_codon:yes gene_type:complete